MPEKYNDAGELLPQKLLSRKRRRVPGSTGQGWIWQTDVGSFSSKELAERLGISLTKLRENYRDYGFDLEQFLTSGRRGATTEGCSNRGSWGPLSARSREKLLKKIPGVGSWEKENL